MFQFKREASLLPSKFIYSIYIFLFLAFLPFPLCSQEKVAYPLIKESQQKDEELRAPAKVNVKPHVYDQDISERLKSILEASGWFTDPKVEVKDGIVFLYGYTDSYEYKKWAKELANNTEDTVAVVNHIQVRTSFAWNFEPFLEGLHEQWQGLLKAIPSLFFGVIILIITWLIAKGATFFTHLLVKSHIDNALLQRVVVWGVGLGIILIGLYSIFHLMGLTTVALTVVGGTGLLGIILGIAFKEITENLLASIFLSINNPFHKGDLIEIEGVTGYVQSLTVRSTILINLEGNYVQIPNATVYKSKIRNYTSNPNRREKFTIGISYSSSISDAQEIALEVLKNHPTVLNDPEAWVLVDNLSSAVVNLRVYFWIDGRKHSWLKVRSSVIRLIKRAFQAEGISMPDETRERVFPDGIKVWMNPKESHEPSMPSSPTATALLNEEDRSIATEAEGELHSEAENIQKQSHQSQTPEKGRNLLNNSEE